MSFLMWPRRVQFVFVAAGMSLAVLLAWTQGAARTASDFRIEIVKHRRVLTTYSGRTPLKSYRIGLGFAPVGAKQRQGDGRTPEGRYWVCSKNPKSQFRLSLEISYPNARDAKHGLAKRRITKAQHSAIVRAAMRKARPPWDTPLGGEIFIHGNGSTSDWTLGCIALDDADIDDLYRRTPVGTPVLIRP